MTLLGDAAHPMTTILGQGACMALEDAAALGRHFAGAHNVEAALRAYEAERLDRTAQLQKLVRRLAGRRGSRARGYPRPGDPARLPARPRRPAAGAHLRAVRHHEKELTAR